DFDVKAASNVETAALSRRAAVADDKARDGQSGRPKDLVHVPLPSMCSRRPQPRLTASAPDGWVCQTMPHGLCSCQRIWREDSCAAGCSAVSAASPSAPERISRLLKDAT